jgi:hypothetical protein
MQNLCDFLLQFNDPESDTSDALKNEHMAACAHLSAASHLISARMIPSPVHTMNGENTYRRFAS